MHTDAELRQPAKHTRRNGRRANRANRPGRCPNVSACFYAPTVTTLRDSLVKPLGKRTSDTFEKVLGLRTAGDLLRHYPRRYYTRGELTPLDSLHEGDHVTVLAMVDLVSRFGPPTDHRYGTQPRKWGSERLEVIVTDGPGKLQLVFFGSVGHHAHQLGRARSACSPGRCRASAAVASSSTPSTRCSRAPAPTR